MDIVLVVLAGLLLLLGLTGCIIPMLPGTPLCYLGIIVLHFTSYAEFSIPFLVLWAGIIILVQGLNYIIPIWGTKKFGGSKKGAWGSMIGMLIGLVFGGPLGIIVGTVVGAFVGEMLAGKETGKAIRAAFGSFIGFIFGTIPQLVVAGFLIFYYIEALIKAF
ncbi:MAG: DUF456 domain-containing protein [Paludibacter sp.]